ncbi:MAG: 3-phosphoshikimate 1-carboxyvinyltransferase, partial [Acidobacteria bacterium]|nr:3-phosphoshikimate 1-carboxyvinyltransferase [Acidobacteriota bacterium]
MRPARRMQPTGPPPARRAPPTGPPGARPPRVIRGAALRGATYEPPVASAQVKSAVLLAGLHAAGTTQVIEPVPTRDHTERALPAFGIDIDRANGRVAVSGGQHLTPAQLRVPGDLSSAAFWASAAAALPGSAV